MLSHPEVLVRSFAAPKWKGLRSHAGGFINILRGLQVVPKIIMFVGLFALISGFVSGSLALFHNPKISAGVALMFASLSWRDWEQARWCDPNPPYKGHWEFGRVFWGLIFSVPAAYLFRMCYLAWK